jgi:ABC-type nickel/cobalt efflux system permease component RcnA
MTGAEQMTPLMRAALVSLLVPMLACRALTALYVELQGPLHFHLDDDHQEHHDHDHAERHHHSAADPTVVTLENRDGLASEETIARGWSATMCVALVPTHAWPDPSPLRRGVAPAGDTRFQTRSLGRLERPPRLAPA